MKAIFMDYTGTMIQESGKDVEQMVKRLYENSDIDSPQAMVQYWWKLVKQFEDQSYGESYLTQDEIVDATLEVCKNELNLKDNVDEIHKLCQRFWMYAPAFDDVKEFFETCPYPIYVLTNNGTSYVAEGMRDKGLHPAGIISGDMVKAYKPHKELFEKALEISGCTPDEVVHIGDSIVSDVMGALQAGIQPILLDRSKEKSCEEAIVVHSLAEVLDAIESFE